MLRGRVSQQGSPQWRRLLPWASLLALNLLFIAPGVALEIKERPSTLLALSGELMLLIAAAVVSMRWSKGRHVRRLLAAVGVILWVFLLDELVARAIIYQSPPLYDQAFLVRHLGVLVFDLWSWKVGLALLGVLLALAALIWLARRLLKSTVSGLHRLPVRHQQIGAAVIAAGLVGGTALDTSRKTPRRERLIHWTAPPMQANLAASWRMYQALQRGLENSPYAQYAQAYPLQRKPDIHLWLVESYGRLLIIDPEAGPAWREQIEGIEARLSAKGWHAVSAFSRAPISGGRSWLAEGTLLTGVYVRFEAVFQHLVADIEKTPNLVSYLDAQGYETILIAPKDKPRPGVGDVNRYNYDRRVQALDLDYNGPRFGWGIIPDQYTLGFVRDTVLPTIDAPVFTDFHMVSSHAPWQMIPVLVDDWRTLNDATAPEGADEQDRLATPNEEFMSRVRRFRRHKPKYTWMGHSDALKIDAYAAAIRYDLELLARQLEGMDEDAIVIIMGDHQPPLLSREDSSYDVPVHILARDPAMLEEFREQGFIDGLALNTGRETLMAHEGMFSMIVRALTRCCGENPGTLPQYLPDGAVGMDDRGRG